MHSGYMFMVVSTLFSDHCLLVLANVDALIRHARFRFENFWPRLPHSSGMVQHAWEILACNDCLIVRIKRKMQKVAVDLKTWSKILFSEGGQVAISHYKQSDFQFGCGPGIQIAICRGIQAKGKKAETEGHWIGGN